MKAKTEFISKEKLKKEILKAIEKYLDLKKYEIFLFGSRASRKAKERSDIDIGIKGAEEIPLDIMAKIREEIFDIPTLYHIDVVDFSSVGKDFKEIAKKNIEIIK